VRVIDDLGMGYLNRVIVTPSLYLAMSINNAAKQFKCDIIEMCLWNVIRVHFYVYLWYVSL